MKKRIILYHTVYNLGKENDFLEQLRGSMAAFLEQKEAITLLWYQENCEFESETIRKAYEEIVEQYLASDIGSIVKKENLNKAKELAELYYGNNVAVALEFLAKGKKAISQQISGNYVIETTLLDGDYLWAIVRFGEKGLNGLYRIDKKTWNAEYISSPEKKLPSWSFGTLHRKEDKIYCVPLGVDYIAVYGIESSKWEKISLPDPKYRVFLEKGNYFGEAVFYKNNIYMFAYLYPGIAKYDIIDKTISYMSDCAEKYECEKPIHFARKLHKEEDKVIFYSRNWKKLMCFDMKTEQLLTVLDLCEYPRFDCFEIVGDDFWLIAGWKDSVVLKYNRKTKAKKLIKYNSSEAEEKEIGFGFSLIEDGKIWAIPALLDKAYKIDLEREVVEMSKEFEPIEKGTPGIFQYHFFVKDKERLYAGTSGKEIIEYNTKTKERSVHRLSFFGYQNAYSKTVRSILDFLLEENNGEEQAYVIKELSNGKKIWETIEV